MITTTHSKALFLGNGIATLFPFTFKIWHANNISVEITDPLGVTKTVLPSAVTITENGGSITYVHEGSPLPTGYKLAILRSMPFLQDVDLVSGTRFDPSVIEEALDKATAERQQLQEAVSRSVKLSSSAEITADELLKAIFTAQSEGIKNAAISQEASAQAQESSSQATQEANRAKEEADRVAAMKGEVDNKTLVNTLDILSVKTTRLSENPTESKAAYPAAVGDVQKVQKEAQQAQEKANQAYELAQDYIVDYYPKTDAEKTSAGRTAWRVWKSGLIEQWFSHTSVGTGFETIHYPVPFTNANSIIGIVSFSGLSVGISSTFGANYLQLGSKTTTNFISYGGNSDPYKTKDFYVKGY